MITKQQIYTVGALCGAGKTHSAIQEAIELAIAGERIAIIQPTLKLSAESASNCRQGGAMQPIKISQINSNGTDSVKDKIKAHLSTPCSSGEILFVTHSAWTLVCGDGWPNKEQWNLIIDEVPPVDMHFCENVPDNHQLFTNLLQTRGKNSSGYSRLIARSTARAKVEEIALNRRQDRISEIFQTLATWLISPHWEVWVDDEGYKELLTGGIRQLNASAVLKPSIVGGFKSVTVMGALFTDTNMSVIWRQMGVDFVSHPTIPGRLQYTAHANGRHIDIWYMYDALYSKIQDKKHRLFELMANAVRNQTADDEPFLWLANKCVEDSPFKGMSGVRLPNTPHGQNGYQAYNKIAFMPALNQTPFHGGFLKNRGFDEDGLHRALALQSTYQACMRTSIRDPQNLEPKTIYVFSKQVADWLQEIFSGSTVSLIPGLPHIDFKPVGRPEKIKTKEDARETKRLSQARYRAKKRAENTR